MSDFPKEESWAQYLYRIRNQHAMRNENLRRRLKDANQEVYKALKSLYTDIIDGKDLEASLTIVTELIGKEKAQEVADAFANPYSDHIFSDLAYPDDLT